MRTPPARRRYATRRRTLVLGAKKPQALLYLWSKGQREATRGHTAYNALERDIRKRSWPVKAYARSSTEDTAAYEEILATLAIVLDIHPPYSNLPAPFCGLGAIVSVYHRTIPPQYSRTRTGADYRRYTRPPRQAGKMPAVPGGRYLRDPRSFQAVAYAHKTRARLPVMIASDGAAPVRYSLISGLHGRPYWRASRVMYHKV